MPQTTSPGSTPSSSSSSASHPSWKTGFATDIGMKRQQNQDNVGCYPEEGFYIVADGMGGHRGGETASAMAVEIIAETLKKDRKNTRTHPKDVLTEAFRKASGSILKRSLNEATLQGMGTTATVVLTSAEPAPGESEGKVYIGHVGDSRCYLLRPSEKIMWQITRDHSLVQEKLRAGMITREQAKTDRMKNVITRSVGFDSALQVDIYEFDSRPGDFFLMCSDGLSGLVEDQQILEIVKNSTTHSERSLTENLQLAVKDLITTANSNGGDDNITAVLIHRDG